MTLDWQEGMSVGVEEIDVHHRQVLRRVRHLAKAVAAGRASEIRKALVFMHGYLSDHHVVEERWMAETGYPAARDHARAHAGMVERLRMASKDTAAGCEGRLLQAAEFIGRALEAHMRVDDVRLARFWTARQNLRILAEKGPGVGAALTPIPGMLASVSPEDDAADEEGDEPSPRPGGAPLRY